MDGMFMMQNIRETQGMSIIFDIKRYIPGNNKYEDYGFAIFPLFSSLRSVDNVKNELYVNSGIYSVIFFNCLTLNDYSFRFSQV